ncbi:ES1 protein homolog, mitochondrial-like [Rhinolophus ferrumequinum]|uniref:ES1 protein homolog, mitochondrial-like n=1 Tax=Rhinolophus ferrumequinum TaxID=59479 RepID=UPI00140F5A21|nr:ES1 protein homolog, mitochondrial-like [Rhinolophus ferrumequinum]XP_032960494.1 ES1 protein homolog, mitochondrial-like [Rhinolophus ferrumequinum]
MHMANHLKGSPTEEKRNVLEESARRVHGDIHNLADLNFRELDAVIIPGNLGVAQNCTVNHSVKDCQASHGAKEPISWYYISPVLAAKTFLLVKSQWVSIKCGWKGKKRMKSLLSGYIIAQEALEVKECSLASDSLVPEPSTASRSSHSHQGMNDRSTTDPDRCRALSHPTNVFCLSLYSH